MGSGLKKRKGKQKKTLCAYDFIPTKEHIKWDDYCIKNNIRISPKPTQRGMEPEEWRIEIRVGPYQKGEKAYLSPNAYTAESIHQELYNMKKYYYDKRSR